MDDDKHSWLNCKLGHASALTIDVWYLNLWLFCTIVHGWYYLAASDVFEC